MYNPLSVHRIPHEMRQYKQWVVWRHQKDDDGKPTKIAYSPLLKNKWADVSDPLTWSDFETAVKLYLNNSDALNGVGFVLTENDPYCFIDFDYTEGDSEKYLRQRSIYDKFSTFAEISPSGSGLHLICRGSVPQGRKRDKIEIYSKSRWMTMTGSIYNNQAIEDCSELCHLLWSQMGKDTPKQFYDPNAPQTETDEQVMERAANAANSDLFLDLFAGRWQGHGYPSQSEADLALVNIIGFYTQHRPQICRLFWNSALGKREKAKRKDYMDWMIVKAFDQLLPPIDVAGMAEALNALLVKERPVSQREVEITGLSARADSMTGGTDHPAATPSMTDGIGARPINQQPLHLQTPPRGLLGEIAQFIYQQSPRKVPEAALTAAIGLMIGLAGRCYNVKGSGLNQYVLFLAPTGSGKEAISSGIDKIINIVAQQVPTIRECIGPSHISSGQAIMQALAERPCHVSIVGEFDNMLKRMSSSNNFNTADAKLKSEILNLYQKSGNNRTSGSSSFADTTKNIASIERPSFSILGECTPELLFRSVDEELITAGLLPRFTIIEYRGKVPYLDEDAHTVQPSQYLVDKMATFAEYCIRLNANNQIINIEIAEDANRMLKAFGDECTDKVNNNTSISRQLWNRAHLKTLKLAGTIAAGVEPLKPVIQMQDAVYAKSLILYDITNLLERYETGAMGATSDEAAQLSKAKECIKAILKSEYNSAMASYGVTRKMYDLRVFPMTFFSRRLASLAIFNKDRIGAANAVKRVIQRMIDDGGIIQVPKQQAAEMLDAQLNIYSVNDPGYYGIGFN